MFALLKIFDILPGWVWALIVAGVMFTAGVQTSRLNGEQKDHAVTKASFEEYKGRVEHRENIRAQAAMLETNKQRDLEKLRRTAAQKAQDEIMAEATRNAAARVAADARRKLLNDTIDRVTAPSSLGGAGSGDSAALRRAEETAATLGRLLKACRAEGDGDAGELEQLAGQVRGLITQYQGLLASPPATAAQPGG